MIQNDPKYILSEKIKLVNIVCCMTSFLFTSIFEESMRKCSGNYFKNGNFEVEKYNWNQNFIEGVNNRFKLAEESISELQYRSIKMMQSGQLWAGHSMSCESFSCKMGLRGPTPENPCIQGDDEWEVPGWHLLWGGNCFCFPNLCPCPEYFHSPQVLKEPRGVTLPPRGPLAISGDEFSYYSWEVRYYWHLVGTGQGCC